MPQPNMKRPKPIGGSSLLSKEDQPVFNAKIAGRALVDGLEYLKVRLEWSGTKIASILHLPANTLNIWLNKNKTIPVSHILQPHIQAVVHLLAIHRSLETMFENPAHQRAWLSTPHPELNEKSPEEIMGTSMEGLIFVRQYLDYVRARGA